jgi:hypothetical protein
MIVEGTWRGGGDRLAWVPETWDRASPDASMTRKVHAATQQPGLAMRWFMGFTPWLMVEVDGRRAALNG